MLPRITQFLTHNCQKTGPFETKIAIFNIKYRTFNSTNLLKPDSSFYEENFIVSEILRNFNFSNFEENFIISEILTGGL